MGADALAQRIGATADPRPGAAALAPGNLSGVLAVVRCGCGLRDAERQPAHGVRLARAGAADIEPPLPV